MPRPLGMEKELQTLQISAVSPQRGSAQEQWELREGQGWGEEGASKALELRSRSYGVIFHGGGKGNEIKLPSNTDKEK